MNQLLPVFDALAGASPDAAGITQLFWIMTAGGAVIWLVVSALALHASRSRRQKWSERDGLKLIVIAGCVIPALALSALLAYGMPVLARHRTAATDPAVRVTIVGEQYWWRVRYQLPDGGHVDLANEIRLPRGQATQVTLTSTNVIHSFWIPAIAGKVDMIPGRMTHLMLEPDTLGIFRGSCAEYCGASHARMSFVAEVVEPDAFARWLTAQAEPAPTGVAGGAAAFQANGCAACHTVRGTAASATIGPDLTHVGSRHRIAAGTLPNESDAIARWLARPDHLKPGALMPPFEALPESERRTLAEYVRSLR